MSNGFIGKEKMAKTGALSGANLEVLWRRHTSKKLMRSITENTLYLLFSKQENISVKFSYYIKRRN